MALKKKRKRKSLACLLLTGHCSSSLTCLVTDWNTLQVLFIGLVLISRGQGNAKRAGISRDGPDIPVISSWLFVLPSILSIVFICASTFIVFIFAPTFHCLHLYFIFVCTSSLFVPQLGFYSHLPRVHPSPKCPFYCCTLLKISYCRLLISH